MSAAGYRPDIPLVEFAVGWLVDRFGD
jgi:hypothetical protein